jgi:mono/diheme cytochrome c family protein
MKSSRNVFGTGERPRPERGAKPPSESERGWGPASAEKSRLSFASRLVAPLICLLFLTGCRQDMHNQPKYRPLRATTFFTDGSSARPLVEGTVARGTLQEDEAFFTGKIGATPVAEMPFPVDEKVLNRGEERYNIFCTPCHDATGGGKGMVVQRGYRQPTSFHIDRLRQVPPGHFFDVMTNGLGAMPDYRAQISPRDRWAIVAYIKALQLSQHTPASEIPGGDPTKLTTEKPAAKVEKH